MKLKYYLRGLGIGIIVTAIIMMITNAGSGKTLTDEQIMQRAEELGMTRPAEDSEESEEGDSGKKGAPSSIGVFSPEENQTSGDAKKPEETQLPENGGETGQPEDAKDAEPENSTNPDDSKEEGNTESSEGSGGDSKTPGEGTGGESAGSAGNGNEAGNSPQGAEGDVSEPSQQPEMVTIEISKGEYSDSVSRKLVEAGLISDAVDFNSYLVKNGMDNLLAVGVHQIPQGANYEEIAGALCRR